MTAPALATAPDPALLAAMKEAIRAELAPVQEQLDEQKASLARASEWSATIEQKVATATATAMALHGTSARGAAMSILDKDAWTAWESYASIVSTAADGRMLLEHALSWCRVQGVDARGLTSVEQSFAMITPFLMSAHMRNSNEGPRPLIRPSSLWSPILGTDATLFRLLRR